MFTHGLNAFSQCVNRSATKRKISELAVSSSCPSDSSSASLGCVPSAPCSWLTPFAWDPMAVLCWNAGRYFSEGWQQRSEFGGSLWPWQGDLLRWSWQRSLQLFLYDSVQLWTCLFYLYLRRVHLKIGYVLLLQHSVLSATGVHITVLYPKDELRVQVPLVPQHQLDQSDVALPYIPNRTLTETFLKHFFKLFLNTF